MGNLSWTALVIRPRLQKPTTLIIAAQTFGTYLAPRDGQGHVRMLRISVVESPRRCRLVVEGKLIAPWAAELAAECERARADLHGRELIVDLRSLTAISAAGETVLLQLMKNQNVKFRCGVFMKEVLRRLVSTSR